MIRRTVAAMLVALGCASPAGAQTDGWGAISNTSLMGNGVAACWDRGGNSACLMLTCRNGGPFEIGLMAYGGGFGYEPLLPVFIRVDGGPVHALRMTPLSLVDYQHAAVTYDPAQHAGLIAALRTGGMATVAVYDPNSNPLPYVLGNRPAAVDGAMASCGVAASGGGAGGSGTPVSDPARFVLVDPALAHPEATALARSLLAETLAREPGTDVTASLAVLPDGRRIVVAEHGVSTSSYGVTGVGTFVFTAEAGGPFRLAYSTPGARLWLDTAQLSEGFPDVWVQAYRGVSQPYGIWRHVGGRYQHQGNRP